MSNLDVPIAGFKPNFFFFVGSAEMFFMIFILFYLWPLKIDPDFENPVPFYYPLMPSFWGRVCSH